MKIFGKIVDIHKKNIFSGCIVISEGKIREIQKCETESKNYILPGFIDAHVHIESSMVTPSQFAAAAVRHGTVAVVSDPHEIANVMGVKGVEYMIADAARVPLKFCFGAPSCVPATAFETSGASINASQIKDLMRNPDIAFLAEMMNFPGVIYKVKEVTEKLSIAKTEGKVIDGHAPGLRGEDLETYVNSGISTDHECSSVEEAKEKLSLGMKILIREGSAAKNLDALKSLLKSDPENVMLCSDDIHPEMLEKGHINLMAAKLIRDGYDLFDVLRACSVNPKEHYKLKTGTLMVGDWADFIVTDDLSKMIISQTWINGECVYKDDKVAFDKNTPGLINHFNSDEISAEQIRVKREGNCFKVIRAYNGELYTDSYTVSYNEGDYVEGNTKDDVLKIVVKDRYNNSKPSVGFINGFGLKEGAFASSVAHDSHNIIAIGTDDDLIAEAVNMIVRQKGGMSVVNGDRKLLLPLPVAGIMSDKPIKEVAGKYLELSETVKNAGCKMDAPFMTLSFMALLVIPRLKMSDRGLFDVTTFSLTQLFSDK